MKSLKCKKCGFFFSLEAAFESISEEEYQEVTACPCGEQMEEVTYALGIIPTV